MTKLTWKTQRGFGVSYLGFLGKHRACTIYFRSVRDSNGSYALSFALPGLVAPSCVHCSDKVDDLKEEANAVVERWLKDAEVL